MLKLSCTDYNVHTPSLDVIFPLGVVSYRCIHVEHTKSKIQIGPLRRVSVCARLFARSSDIMFLELTRETSNRNILTLSAPPLQCLEPIVIESQGVLTSTTSGMSLQGVDLASEAGQICTSISWQ
jgi:hypothetical protein